MGEVFRNHTTLDHVKAAQRRHWVEFLFAGRWNDEYSQNCRRIGSAHAKYKISPRHYLAGYSFFLDELTERIITHYRRKPKLAVRAMKAAHAALFLDLTMSLEVYFEIERTRTNKAVEGHSNEFQGTGRRHRGQSVRCRNTVGGVGRSHDGCHSHRPRRGRQCPRRRRARQ